MYKSVPMDSDNDEASFGYGITTCDLLKGSMTKKKCAAKKLDLLLSHTPSYEGIFETFILLVK